MATLRNGALGGFSGKAGPVVGYRFRGKDRLRALPQPSTKKPSELQLASRLKFKVIQQWRSHLTDIFAITFKNHSYERSAQNAAHRFNTGVVIGDYPNLSIDWSKICFSNGNLPQVTDLKMEMGQDQTLHIAWGGMADGISKPNDLVAIMVHYDVNDHVQSDLAAANRAEGQCNLKLNYPSGSSTADVYFTVLSNDREEAAVSVYLGNVLLSPGNLKALQI